MSYKHDVKDYKAKATQAFKQHLSELEANVISVSTRVENTKPSSELYLEYQASSLELIMTQIKIDNEFLKQINIQNLEKYKQLEPEKFQQIQDKILNNHKMVIEDLKLQYEQIAKQSREELKYKLAEAAQNNDLKLNPNSPEDFFADKVGVLTINFAIIFLLLILIIGLTYYYIFM